MRVALTEVLLDQGLIVDLASNGRDALERARQARPALVILDITLPILDGYGVADALHADDASCPSWPSPPTAAPPRKPAASAPLRSCANLSSSTIWSDWSSAVSRVLLTEIVETSAAVGATAGPIGKNRAARRDPAAARASRSAHRRGVPVQSARQRQIGVGYAAIRDRPVPSETATLSLTEVDRALEAIGQLAGRDSQAERRRQLDEPVRPGHGHRAGLPGAAPVGRASSGCARRRHARRDGAGIGAPLAEVRRAVTLRGDLGAGARSGAARRSGQLDEFRLQVPPLQRCWRESAPSSGRGARAHVASGRSNGSSTARACRFTGLDDDVSIFTRSPRRHHQPVPRVWSS